MSDELKERPIDFETERLSQLEIDAAVAEITARLKAADANDVRIKELEAENKGQVEAFNELDNQHCATLVEMDELKEENQRLRDTILYAKGRMKAYGIVDARIDLPGGGE